MQQTIPLLLSISILSACSVGLQTDGPLIIDSGFAEEPSSEPSDDVADTNDTNTTDTNTADTNDTNTTDSGTGTSGTFIPSLIASATPLYGNTTGGDSVTITGGPFTGDATVTFGGYAGTVISNNGSMIRVNTPSALVDGPVEVRIDMDDGYGLVPDPFVYFEDGLGKQPASE